MQFLKLPYALITDKNITSNEFRIYSYLMSKYNESKKRAFPSFDQISKQLNISKMTVNKSIKKLSNLGYMTISKKTGITGNYNEYSNFKFLVPNKNTVSKREPSKDNNLKPVDSNGNAPLENQIHVKEIIEESEPNNMDLIKNEFGAIKATQKERQVINQETTEIVLQAIREVKEQGITVTSLKYLINKIKFMKNNENVKKSNVSEVTPKNCNNLKFNNFEPRQYDYDLLEKIALGEAPEGLSYSDCLIRANIQGETM